MDLIVRLRRFAFARPGVLVVAAPGATAIRLAAERFVRVHGWRAAYSPADADIVVVAGAVTPELAEIADVVQHQSVPPSVRVDLTDPVDVDGALGRARARLATGGDQHTGEHTTSNPPMADRAPDRDGLALDVLNVPLGPVLPYWPDGLRLRAVVQGDVIQDVAVDMVGASDRDESFWEPAERRGARRLHAIGRLLGTAGWHGMALRCQRLRDDWLRDRRPPDGVHTVLNAMWRNRLLRTVLTGVGPMAGGDAWRRLRDWCADVTDTMAAVPEHAVAQPDTERALELLPGLLAGEELAMARLVVASLDIDLAEVQSERTRVPHG